MKGPESSDIHWELKHKAEEEGAVKEVILG